MAQGEVVFPVDLAPNEAEKLVWKRFERGWKSRSDDGRMNDPVLLL